MPRGDATGPFGSGPLGKRAAGFCGGNNVTGLGTGRPGQKRGGGSAWGRLGNFCRNWFRGGAMRRIGGPNGPNSQTSAGRRDSYRIAAQDEKQALQNQARMLQRQLDEIKARLKNLSNQPHAQP